MDIQIVHKGLELIQDVICQAGEIARQKFNTAIVLKTKDEYGDVLTEVDLLAEQLIISRIESEFPTHQIHSEEAGSLGNEGDWLWLIDPLDGTNNFAIGLSVFTLSVTLLYKRGPILGVIYEPMTNRMFSAIKGQASFCNGE